LQDRSRELLKASPDLPVNLQESVSQDRTPRLDEES
jgi:hypothetical protein